MVYCDGIGSTFNEKYYYYLIDNNYGVLFNNLSDYIEGIKLQEYYTINEIKELEPQILESLKLINEEKNKKLVIKK